MMKQELKSQYDKWIGETANRIHDIDLVLNTINCLEYYTSVEAIEEVRRKLAKEIKLEKETLRDLQIEQNDSELLAMGITTDELLRAEHEDSLEYQ